MLPAPLQLQRVIDESDDAGMLPHQLGQSSPQRVVVRLAKIVPPAAFVEVEQGSRRHERKLDPSHHGVDAVGRPVREAGEAAEDRGRGGGRPAEEPSAPTDRTADALDDCTEPAQSFGYDVVWLGNDSSRASAPAISVGVLGAGDSYTSPWLYGAYGDGLDELAGRFHRHLRAREQHPSSPRPGPVVA